MRNQLLFLLRIPYIWMSSFPLTVFRIFFFSLEFVNLLIMTPFRFKLCVVCWAWLFISSFSLYLKGFRPLFLQIFFCLFILLFSMRGYHYEYVDMLNRFIQVSEDLFIYLHFFFLFCYSDMIISIALFSSSLKLFSVC